MKKKYFIFIGILFFIAAGAASIEMEEKGCFSENKTFRDDTISQLDDQKELKVLFLGDTGMANQHQFDVARASALICKKIGCDIAVLLGDNFYPDGVSSVNDEQFKIKFDQVYSQNVPFFAVLGNHDFRGNWKAQIEYTKMNERWILPATNYKFAIGPAYFQVINTSCLPLASTHIQTPDSGKWNILLGHFPYITSSSRGSRWYLPGDSIIDAGFDFYFSGHDHLLEHLQKGSLEQIISGGGGGYLQRESSSVSEYSKFFARSYGFVWGKFSKEKAQIRFFNENGEPIYNFTKSKKVD